MLDPALLDLPLLDLVPLTALGAVPLALAGTSFALGVRHALDWYHIAAITDLTAPRPGEGDDRSRHGRRGLGLSLWYCIGHGLVLAVLGALVLLLGLGLPPRFDAVFELGVGLTLVTLGGVVLYQLGRYRSDYRYTGRISLVVGALRLGWARARRREVLVDALDVDRRGAFLVGTAAWCRPSSRTDVTAVPALSVQRARRAERAAARRQACLSGRRARSVRLRAGLRERQSSVASATSRCRRVVSGKERDVRPRGP